MYLRFKRFHIEEAAGARARHGKNGFHSRCEIVRARMSVSRQKTHIGNIRYVKRVDRPKISGKKAYDFL